MALTAVLLISFYMEPSEIHNTVCAFVYRVRDCKHPVPAIYIIKVITKLPNSEQSYKGKVKTHNYINRQNQSTTGKL